MKRSKPETNWRSETGGISNKTFWKAEVTSGTIMEPFRKMMSQDVPHLMSTSGLPTLSITWTRQPTTKVLKN